MAAEAPALAGDPFALPPAQERVREQARALAARWAERHREVRLHTLEHSELHPELWGELCAQGWPGLLVPPESGGSRGGLFAYALVLEALAEANIVLWAPVLDAAISHAIAEVGPERAQTDWLERVAAGDVHLALAVTEPECGHNVFRSATTVRSVEGGFVLDGCKAVTSAIDLAARVLVFARCAEPDRGEAGKPSFTTLLVDPQAPGVTRTELPMRGREGVRQFQLDFASVEVGAEALVGAEGQGLLALWPSTHVERILLAALAVGNAGYCIARALDRAGTRGVFGQRPIGAEQAIQHPLAELHARLEATRLLVRRTAARFDAGIDRFQLAGEANMAKVLSAQLVFDAADHAVHTLGAAAWDEREGMIDLYLDARLSRSAPVSQELALNFIAQHVLGLPSHR